jgi:hypothetical protein
MSDRRDSDVPMEPDDQTQLMLDAYYRNLDVYRLQAAQFGPHCPAYIQVQIAELEDRIRELVLRADNILCEPVRAFFLRAVAAFDQGEYTEAAGEAIGGLMWALDRIHIALVHQAEWVLLKSAETPPYRNYHSHIPVLYTLFGLRYAEYLRARNIVGNVILIPSSTKVVVQRINNRPPPVDVAGATFVLRHCLKSILQIERQAGDIEHPFQP